MIKSSVNIHFWAYLVALILVAISLPLSKFAMSVAQFVLLGIWLWSGFSFRIAYRFFKLGGFFYGFYHLLGYLLKLPYRNFIDKFDHFFRDRAAMIFTSIFLLHIVGLIHTEDMGYAMKDLRIKLPLLLFPVVISTMYTIRYRHFRLLMLFYVGAIIVGSFISFGLIIQGDFTDIRYTSPFISSIRFSLNVSFAIFSLAYFIIFDQWFKNWHKIVMTLAGIWFLVYLILIESITGIGIVIIITLFYLVYQLFQSQSRWVRLTTLLLIILIPAGSVFFVYNTVSRAITPPAIDQIQLEQLTADGNPYTHDTIIRGIEDGRYIGLYLCEKELEEAWEKRSDIDYFHYPEDGHELRETLIRYLTSMGLRKDRGGVESLSDKDIELIEQGIANHNYIYSPGLRIRILKMLLGYEVYKKTGDPSGSSVMQRIVYSKASIDLIQKYFWIGVGTGDIENSLIEQYELMKSGLGSDYMFHAHNQFFAIFITFGVFGFIWFLIAFIYPAYKRSRFSDYFFLTFFLIITWSMLSDDTLETQAGVTLFAFFYALLVFGKDKQNARS